ncbi:Universal stress protein family [Chryseobacterium gleum]|uniref:Universal stress protein n=2 Tax=Chryseobacterium gleum TaxID=250 RepID=A0A3S4R5X1_CHRGE|nr:Universal stress protein family [Chryseobacterium gleum]VFA43951.1 Universal stress protein family [Chryseobacterium indologenes]
MVDETPLSQNVVKCGYTLAKQLTAEVALLHVENSKEYHMDMLTEVNPAESDKTFMQNMHYLENLSMKFSDGVQTKIFVMDGRIKESVLSAAREWNAQLIVAGTHERKGLGRLFKESVSEDILHSSPVPMLIVPEKNKTMQNM